MKLFNLFSKKETEFDEYKKFSSYKQLGRFRNQFGELYVLFTVGSGRMVSFAGDETNWQVLTYLPEVGVAGNFFGLNENEIKNFTRIIKNAKKA